MYACYVFSNGEKLYYLAKNNDVEGLIKEIENSTIEKMKDRSEVFMGTCYLFERIYNMLVDAKEFETVKKISRKIEKLCAASWDVATLFSIKTKAPMCGEMSSTGEKVIAEYEAYKAIAVSQFDKRNPEPKWEMTHEDVLFIFDKGRLSFIKDEVEHVIYYGEDKYFNLIYGSDNKAQMILRNKTYQ